MYSRTACCVFVCSLTVLTAMPVSLRGQRPTAADSARYAQGLVPVAAAVVNDVRYRDTDAVIIRTPGGRPPHDIILLREGTASATLFANALAVLALAHEQEGWCPSRHEVLRVEKSEMRPMYWHDRLESEYAPKFIERLKAEQLTRLPDFGNAKWLRWWIPRLVPMRAGDTTDVSAWWKGEC